MPIVPRTTDLAGRVILQRGKARPIWAGHPWIFSGAIERAEVPEGAPGGVVAVCDHNQKRMGVGTYNPTARIAVRMLGADLPAGGIAELIKQRIDAARRLRAQFGLPNEQTTAYRLLNSEGDGLPGVIIDIFGTLASVQLTTAAAESWREHILAALDQPIVTVSVPVDSARMEGIAPGDRFGRGDDEEHVALMENGLTWQLKPGKGQKTGFYTDQRDNRRLVGQLAAGGSVLDAFCYTGGFGLNCAQAGATEVVGVDSSGPAVSVAAGTARQNGLTNTSFHKEDALRFLRGLGDRCFDMVVLDPPKLAKSQKNLHDAISKYRAFNVEALKHTTPGGFFVSCSCSGLVDESMFQRLLTDAAHYAKRRLFVHEVRGPGPDHPWPVALGEGRYLTVVIASVRS